VIIGLHPDDLSLLQHELGDQDVVRVPGAAPGEIAAVTAEPAEQSAAEFGGGGGTWSGADRGGLRGHGG
jgi:hypothetical protein